MPPLNDGLWSAVVSLVEVEAGDDIRYRLDVTNPLSGMLMAGFCVLLLAHSCVTGARSSTISPTRAIFGVLVASVVAGLLSNR